MDKQSITKLNNVISHWISDQDIAGNIQYKHLEPASSGSLFPFPTDLSIELLHQLKLMGIYQLYGHQLDSYHTVNQGNNLIVTTGTASGKSLCYNLPIIDHMLKVPSAKAIYLFPTKALTQDQYEKLKSLTGFENGVEAAVYDGDTPVHKRQAIRQYARCLFTNPDMLHTAILPHHTLWEDFFLGLEFVVIDEIHAYRGVFGSHVANVIRRLRRIARFYGSNPLFILTSATIANPIEHGKAIIGDELISIHQDDAPHGQKTILLYNPPVVHKETGIRKSATSEAIQLADTLLNANVQVLIFSRSRRGVEMLLRQLRMVRNDDPSQYHSYRSGYLAADRRRIEADLRDGKLRAVVATNALELGVDIGGIDAVILTGYPGSVSAMRQQAGRAGRKTAPSLAILVATGSPIDQYLMRHPDYLLGQSPESALIDADHPIILLGHLRCAAFELPFLRGEKFGSVNSQLLQEYLDLMANSGVLNEAGEKYYWTDSNYPASTLSLRSSDSQSVSLLLEKGTSFITLGIIDYSSALWMVHPKAIYLHEGNTYYVKILDLEKSTAIVEESDEDYFTEPVKKLTITKISERETKSYPAAYTYFGEIQVTTEITGFKKILWSTREVLSIEPLELPSTTMRTTAYWMALQNDTVETLRESMLWKSDANNYGKNWDQIRKNVRHRDHYQCQVCGLPESSKAHHVHHKSPLRGFLSLEEANRFENLITLCPNCHQLAEANIKIRSGLAGLGYAIGQIAPLFLMCDTTDIGTLTDPVCTIADGKPAVILYDQVNAGIGLSKKCFDLHQIIMLSLQELIVNCECFDGCPSCVGPGGENGVGGKMETLAILDLLCR